MRGREVERATGVTWKDSLKVYFGSNVWIGISRHPQLLYDDADFRKHRYRQHFSRSRCSLYLPP